MARKPFPKKLKHKLLYDSQYVCAVCQQQACHIHHIDQDHSNNDEENLVVLCSAHHDEAHTKRQLSQNLSPDALRDAKQKWTAVVNEKRELAATVSGQLLIAKNSPLASMGIAWGYINHARVGQLARPELLNSSDIEYFEYCRSRGIIDQKGILIKPSNALMSDSYIRNSVYDWYERGDDHRLHRIYSVFVDQISKMVQPIHLESENWTKTQIVDLINPGNFIFLDRAFYFKNVEETQENQHRRVRTARRKISIEFYVDTIDMFGTTSMTVSFSGYKHCGALLQLKSFVQKSKGELVLHCTPIALGVGFNKQW